MGGIDFSKKKINNNKQKQNKTIQKIVLVAVDTTATNTLAAYDRIVAWDKSLDLVLKSSATVYRYDTELANVDQDLLLRYINMHSRDSEI